VGQADVAIRIGSFNLLATSLDVIYSPKVAYILKESLSFR